MTRFLKVVLVAGVLAIALAAQASIIGTSDASTFTDTVDWCANFGCANTPYSLPSPTAWTSAAGNTGEIGMNGTGDPFYVAQQGSTWFGNMPDGMGVIYNGNVLGNTPASIAATSDNGVYGMGAFIESNFDGPFTAEIDLYDGSFNLLGSYTATGDSEFAPGTALFIGAYDDNPDVYAAVFTAWGSGPNEPDFAIGNLDLRLVPEPGSFVLMGSALAGLAGVIRRKAQK